MVIIFVFLSYSVAKRGACCRGGWWQGDAVTRGQMIAERKTCCSGNARQTS